MNFVIPGRTGIMLSSHKDVVLNCFFENFLLPIVVIFQTGKSVHLYYHGLSFQNVIHLFVYKEITSFAHVSGKRQFRR